MAGKMLSATTARQCALAWVYALLHQRIQILNPNKIGLFYSFLFPIEWSPSLHLWPSLCSHLAHTFAFVSVGPTAQCRLLPVCRSSGSEQIEQRGFGRAVPSVHRLAQSGLPVVTHRQCGNRANPSQPGGSAKRVLNG